MIKKIALLQEELEFYKNQVDSLEGSANEVSNLIQKLAFEEKDIKNLFYKKANLNKYKNLIENDLKSSIKNLENVLNNC